MDISEIIFLHILFQQSKGGGIGLERKNSSGWIHVLEVQDRNADVCSTVYDNGVTCVVVKKIFFPNKNLFEQKIQLLRTIVAYRIP